MAVAIIMTTIITISITRIVNIIATFISTTSIITIVITASILRGAEPGETESVLMPYQIPYYSISLSIVSKSIISIVTYHSKSPSVSVLPH